MAKPEPTPVRVPPGSAQRMRLRYGVNETDNWRQFALGSRKEQVWQRLRDLGTSVVRIFLFEKHAPDPVAEWPLFAAYVQAVLDAGARPMVTFARFPPPYDDPDNIRTFAARCGDVVWGCVEQWGPERVRDWYWCIWNEPNNALIGGGLDFPQYRRIYEEAAASIVRVLKPYLRGRKALLGGPAVDGFQPFWMDWIQRFATEIDNELIGFASWHRYGDWRPGAGYEAPGDGAYEALLMAQTPDYEARARGVARLLEGRDILNVCGELNVLSHPDARVSRRFNQGHLGAAYYASALLHLIRGGADLEMWWTATDDASAYGLLHPDGEPTPVCWAKQLFARSVRCGDLLTFPQTPGVNVEALISRGEDGRCAGLIVHLGSGPRTVEVAALSDEPADCRTLLQVDRNTTGEPVPQPFDGVLRFDGYGVALVNNTVQFDSRSAGPWG
jgi:hypothetical protein